MIEGDLINLVNEKVDSLLSMLHGDDLLYAIQKLKITISKKNPFKEHPIDNVHWLNICDLQPNDYNPNVMAPSESRLLELSIKENGFTQPIVVKEDGDKFIIIDGFHRYNLVKKKNSLSNGTNGMIPVVILNKSKRADLIVATVRHNRARGVHQVSLMSDLVKELSLFGLCDKEIGIKLGMDIDEVLRLRQITGLREAFINGDFSCAWTVK